MAGENIPRSLRDATVVLGDAEFDTYKVTLTLEEGNLSLTIPRNHQHVLDRGDVGALIESAFVPITGSMSVYMREWTGSTVTPFEVFMGTAGSWDYTGIVSAGDLTTFNANITGTATLDTKLAEISSDVAVINMEITFANPGGGTAETIYLLNTVVDTASFTEGSPNNFSFNFETYMTRADFMASIQN